MKKQNKILLRICVVIIFLFILEINKGIINYGISISNYIKINLSQSLDSITTFYQLHLNQSNEIARLREIEKQKEYQDIELSIKNSNILNLMSLLDINAKPSSPNVYLVNSHSYVNMGQYSKVWLKDYDNNLDNKKIYGLIRNGYAAGIALFKENRLVGILNGDSKLSYGVYIGDSKSVGILKTNMNNSTVVEYIYAWSDINIGDEIITSGLDGIFFEGIKVGKVKSIRQEYGYIVVDVDLYNKNNDIGYFWLVNVD